MPEFRTPVMTVVEATWKDLTGALQTISARMEDKSTGGACLRVKTPIGVGSKLTIQWRFEQFSGTARYCRSEGKEYLVGIQRDLMNSPLNDRQVSPGVPLPERVETTPAPALAIESPPQPPASKPSGISASEQNVESSPIMLAAALTALPVHRVAHLNPDASHLPSPKLDSPPSAPLQIKQLPRETQADNERKPMRRKWLELPWQTEPEGRNISGSTNGEANSSGKSNGKNEKETLMPPTQPSEKSVHSAREVPIFQVELLPMEDIYRAAGIMNARRGYSINKVGEMLNSEHIRGLSKEMKRVALLMALDAAGVPIDEVVQDARARQEALDSYEVQQRKQVEAGWARKAEENIQIQAELESIRAHYMARISRNLEGVAREKATFDNWVTLKRQECQEMAEAAELCLKAPAPETSSLQKVSHASASVAAAGANQA